MRVIGVIPARGGSKRIPRKNIIGFMGKPMIAWTIEAAKKSSIFDRIVISTDNEEIADIGREYGVEVPFLRKDKYDDISPVSEATISAIIQAEKFFNEEYDIVIQLMANTPLRSSEDIIQLFDTFKRNNRDFQISAFKYGWMNPWWATTINASGTPKWLFPEVLGKRSQDLDDLYCPTGSVWIAKVDLLKNAGTFYGDGYKFCEINWRSAVDIDDYDDLEFARAAYGLKKEK